MNTTSLETYLKIALELSQTAEDVPLSALYTTKDIATTSVSLAEEELYGFISEASEMYTDLYDHFEPETIAILFYLTRNGHGSGFWDCVPSGSDRKDTIANELTEMASAYGSSELFIGDDDKLHFE